MYEQKKRQGQKADTGQDQYWDPDAKAFVDEPEDQRHNPALLMPNPVERSLGKEEGDFEPTDANTAAEQADEKSVALLPHGSVLREAANGDFKQGTQKRKAKASYKADTDDAAQALINHRTQTRSGGGAGKKV